MTTPAAECKYVAEATVAALAAGLRVEVTESFQHRDVVLTARHPNGNAVRALFRRADPGEGRVAFTKKATVITATARGNVPRDLAVPNYRALERLFYACAR